MKPKILIKKILAEAEIIDLSLFFPKKGILVLTDLHLGFEEALMKQGVAVPKFNFNDSIKRLNKIFSVTGKVEKIIILGDLKHEFGLISQQEWSEVSRMLAFFNLNSEKIILLKGNHDNVLGPIAKWNKLSIQDYFFLEKEKILFLHGDKIPVSQEFNKAKILVIGHEHPAVTLSEGVKKEKFKCFLKGKFNSKDLIVVPSFNLTTEGTDVLKEKLLSPFLQQNLDSFEVWIVADKTYFFGKLKELE
ncbi:MAG: metallophosphoesterase [archaeon]